MTTIEAINKRIGVAPGKVSQLCLYIAALLLIAVGTSFVYLPASPIVVGSLILADMTLGSFLEHQKNMRQPRTPRRSFQKALTDDSE